MIKETNFTICLLLFLLISLTGCLTHMNVGCELKDKKAAFQLPEAHFKKEVLNNVSNYTKLRDFIVANLDTIYGYNEQKQRLTAVHEQGMVKNRLDHFAIHDYGPGNMIKDQIPPYLYPKLKKIYNSLNKNVFFGVSFERDSTVSISVNSSDYNSNNVRIVHNLDWRNHKVIFAKDSTNFSRDTTLANGWVYTIYIDCYEGI